MKRKLQRLWLLIATVLVLAIPAKAESPDYDMSWDALSKHPVPEWFQDAKFGIYAHLGVYCVPAVISEWYPRYMYIEGHEVQKYHIEKYGPLSKFGYKDFIPMFKLEKFDADEWAELYKRSGAKFAGPVAEHHDGFSMWASKVNRWNAKDMGPKRDVVGELVAALRKRDMKIITSFHHGFNLGAYFTKVEGADTADPKYADLYGKFEDKTIGYDRWIGKIKEVIDAYQPDQIWFDWCLREIPMEYKRKMVSYYYSQEAKWNKSVIITRKLDQLPDGVGVLDHERGGSRDKTTFLWQSDDSVSNDCWSWREGFRARSAKSMLDELIDIVSKNGILLMNVCPKADGTISDDQKRLLCEMGDWLKVNGEAIYATRPWRIHGEGPRLYGNRGPTLEFNTVSFENPINLRFTTKGDTLYAICLDWPGRGFTFDTVLIKNASEKGRVSLLGYGPVGYKLDGKKLIINPISLADNKRPCQHAYALKLEGFEIAPEPFALPERCLLIPANATPTGQIIVRPANPNNKDVKERDRLYHWSHPQDSIHWLVDIKQAGDYLVRFESGSRFQPGRVMLSNGEDTLKFTTAANERWGMSQVKDVGKIHFVRTGLYRIDLGSQDLEDWPGAEIWQIELAPAQ